MGEANTLAAQRPDFNPGTGDERQRRVERRPAADGKMCTPQFLEHFGRSTQGRLVKNKVTGALPKRARLAHGVHEHADEDHASVVPCLRDRSMTARRCFRSGSASGPARVSHSAKKRLHFVARRAPPDFRLPVESLACRNADPCAQRQLLPPSGRARARNGVLARNR